jgi:hypothetical protein
MGRKDHPPLLPERAPEEYSPYKITIIHRALSYCVGVDIGRFNYYNYYNYFPNNIYRVAQSFRIQRLTTESSVK